MTLQQTMAKEMGIFSRWANYAAQYLGNGIAFSAAIGSVLLWGMTGPVFGYTDTWQLIINTGTSVITFLMVFLIQNTQNRDSAAMQLKLDEIIRSTQGAHKMMLDVEQLSASDLEKLRVLYQEMADNARRDKGGSSADTGTPDIKAA
jgi:low affinity Fe/Cu permease